MTTLMMALEKVLSLSGAQMQVLLLFLPIERSLQLLVEAPFCGMTTCERSPNGKLFRPQFDAFASTLIHCNCMHCAFFALYNDMLHVPFCLKSSGI